MKTILAVFILALCFGCNKEPSTNNGQTSFPGALDSVVYYGGSDTDSAFYSSKPTDNYMKYQYDEAQRVTSIEKARQFWNFFHYTGNNKLPYLQIDSIIASYTDQYNYLFNLYYHQLSYDASGRVIKDSVLYFGRNRYGASFPESISIYDRYSLTYIYVSNSVTVKDSRYASPISPDTTYFNVTGDINKLKLGSPAPFYQNAEQFSADKNPMSELNIAPLYNSLYGVFRYGIDYLKFDLIQPKLMYRKVTGVNPNFYQFNKYDYSEVFFHTQKDASNRITHLVIPHYIHKYSFNGTAYLGYYRYYTNYKFFYHN